MPRSHPSMRACSQKSGEFVSAGLWYENNAKNPLARTYQFIMKANDLIVDKSINQHISRFFAFDSSFYRISFDRFVALVPSVISTDSRVFITFSGGEVFFLKKHVNIILVYKFTLTLYLTGIGQYLSVGMHRNLVPAGTPIFLSFGSGQNHENVRPEPELFASHV